MWMGNKQIMRLHTLLYMNNFIIFSLLYFIIVWSVGAPYPCRTHAHVSSTWRHVGVFFFFPELSLFFVTTYEPKVLWALVLLLFIHSNRFCDIFLFLFIFQVFSSSATYTLFMGDVQCTSKFNRFTNEKHDNEKLMVHLYSSVICTMCCRSQ